MATYDNECYYNDDLSGVSAVTIVSGEANKTKLVTVLQITNIDVVQRDGDVWVNNGTGDIQKYPIRLASGDAIEVFDFGLPVTSTGYARSIKVGQDVDGSFSVLCCGITRDDS